MASYTDLSRSDVDTIASAYGIRVRNVSALAGGAANSSYLLQTDDRPYVLTVLDNHDCESALRLTALLEHLHAYDIPTTNLLHTRDGTALVSLAGQPVLIKEYVAGSCSQELPVSGVAAAGALLARVHSVPTPDWLPRHGRRLPGDWSRETERFADQDFAKWLQEHHEAAATVLRLRGPTGLVHGDYFADNLIVGEDGGIVVLDWETAAHDLLILDLGMAIVGLCRYQGVFQSDRAADLVAGYETHRSLETIERRLLYEAVVYAGIVIAYHRYRRHHLTHPDPAKADLYREIPRFVSSLDRDFQRAGRHRE